MHQVRVTLESLVHIAEEFVHSLDASLLVPFRSLPLSVSLLPNFKLVREVREPLLDHLDVQNAGQALLVLTERVEL